MPSVGLVVVALVACTGHGQTPATAGSAPVTRTARLAGAGFLAAPPAATCAAAVVGSNEPMAQSYWQIAARTPDVAAAAADIAAVAVDRGDHSLSMGAVVVGVVAADVHLAVAAQVRKPGSRMGGSLVMQQ